MPISYLPDSILKITFALFFLNIVLALALLASELLRPPRRFRAAAIALSVVIVVSIAIQFVTGYYIAIPSAKPLVKLAGIAACVVVIVLVLSGRWRARAQNRIVGWTGAALLALLLVSTPELSLGPVLLIGYAGTPTFQGRISQRQSYAVVIDHTLYGGTEYYRYVIFRNSRWITMFRKQLATGPIYGCAVPAFAVGINPGPDDATWEVRCRQTETSMAEGTVGPTSLAAELTTKR